MIDNALMARIRADLDYWEASVLWMYLDSVGLVTVGCGTMLPNSNFASQIPFFHDGNSTVATAAEIIAAWDILHAGSAVQKAAAQADKFSAQHYKSVTDLRITTQTASNLRDVHVRSDYSQLCLIFPTFDDLPDPAKLALFDMIYNLGAGRAPVAARAATRGHRATPAIRGTGLRAYSTMCAAIRTGDWESAAASCHRRGIPAERNRMTASLFRSCIKLQNVNH